MSSNGNEETHLGVLPPNWERSETQEGIPYYINHGSGKTQWEHPVLTELFKQLKTLNDIRPPYGAYRAASKLRTLQVITNLHKVSKENVWSSLKDMNLMQEMESNLCVSEIETLFAKTFSKARDQNKIVESEVEPSIEISLSWALKCYDSGRTGKVLLRSLLTGLIILTSSSITKKYKDLFKVYVVNGHLSDERLTLLLHDALMLIETIEEQEIFNYGDIPGAVASLKSLVQNGDNVTEGRFVEWMKEEPELIVWLPTLHRFVTAETVKHEAKCAGCKNYPIVGFRYRCLKCLNTDLCQNCYWTEKGTKAHKVSHPVREYCMATTTTDDMKDFGSQIRNKITKRYRRRQRKIPYLPTQSIPEGQTETTNNDIHERIANLASQLNVLATPPSHPPPPSPPQHIMTVDVIHHPTRSESEQALRDSRIAELEFENQLLRAKLPPVSTEQHSVCTTSSIQLTVPDTGEVMYARPPLHAPWLPTSTPMTGVSLLTLDDYASCVPGTEEERLRDLTTGMIASIPENQQGVIVNQGTSNRGLFDAAVQVDIALASLLYELNRR